MIRGMPSKRPNFPEPIAAEQHFEDCLVAVSSDMFGESAGAAIIHYAGPDIPIPTTWAGVSVDFELGTTTNDLADAPGMDLNFALGGTYPQAINGVVAPEPGLPQSTIDAIQAGSVEMYVDWVRVEPLG